MLHLALLNYQRSYTRGIKTDSMYIDNSLMEDLGKNLIIYDYM
jgi:hypothetical protein